MITRTPAGRYKVVVKSGRAYAGSKTFDSLREAKAWETRQQSAIRGGVDPRAGRVLVRVMLPEWLAYRRQTVAETTFRADASLVRWLPPSLLNRTVASITASDIGAELARVADQGKAAASLRRYRVTLAAFFSWLVSEHRIVASPVPGVRIPSVGVPPRQIRPLSMIELREAYRMWLERDPVLANVAFVLAVTGLRWSEARALEVGDVRDGALLVQRSRPEGVKSTKTTKSGRVRRVPLAQEPRLFVAEFAAGRGSHDRLFPPLHASGFNRRLAFSETSGGRSIHDLRHTAITLWLSAGVDLATVRKWAGHASLSTTNRYVHWLGDGADALGVSILDRALGGDSGVTGSREEVAPGG